MCPYRYRCIAINVILRTALIQIPMRRSCSCHTILSVDCRLVSIHSTHFHQTLSPYYLKNSPVDSVVLKRTAFTPLFARIFSHISLGHMFIIIICNRHVPLFLGSYCKIQNTKSKWIPHKFNFKFKDGILLPINPHMMQDSRIRYVDKHCIFLKCVVEFVPASKTGCWTDKTVLW